ncbi:MAG: DUF512 domain-containing protein [Oscillospiraceae bacterium]|nr:DUF512 domain-containing protein [Oscillospiraceae bacterium]
MAVRVTRVEKNSPADKAGFAAGTTILSIDGNEINDMLDYEFYTAKPILNMAVSNAGKLEYITLEKNEYEPLGCDFETFLIDKKHTCKNKCMFCFIDQLPKGLRETLYFKDDDERMSFLYGNYITLTNLSEKEVERVKKMHISPVNISVHTTNPELRVKMMTNKHAGEVLRYIDEFAESGIEMNCQIVLCRGVNDGDELRATLQKLTSLYPQVCSIAAVPFGMTRYREGLAAVTPYDKETAAEVIDIIEEYGDKMHALHGVRLVYPADELFLLAQRPVPPAEYYDGYPQIENGIGMWRLYYEEFMDSLEKKRFSVLPVKADIVTGEMAFPLMAKLAQRTMKKYKNLKIKVHPIKNDFFGGNIWVTGLVTGTDIIKQVKGKLISKNLIIPETMLREERDLFLDNVSRNDVEKALHVHTFISGQNGADFIDCVLMRKSSILRHRGR